ncbi:hypothetical protein [Lapidilactobacillus bayanensis]|uniref:hypothetical protein n=1 Tax=Lapidilactobacillus bayanensis TaxID=2485998 RepID=UPI000F7B6575|nr:hypothetical protein [Lapidilactobacillus bayanensis]
MKHNQEQQGGFFRRLRRLSAKNDQQEQVTATTPKGTFVDDLDVSAAKRATAATESMSRVARKQAHEQEFKSAKTVHPDMRRRLNWAIGIVAILIVVVYLVLFFV